MASALDALTGDCAREFSPALIKELKSACGSPKADLFRNNLEGLRAAAKTGSVMEQRLVERVQAREKRGPVDQSGLLSELAGVLDERKESQGRAIRGHVLKDGGKGAAECNEAVRQSLNQISAADMARRILDNDGVIRRMKKVKNVSLDEDLRG